MEERKMPHNLILEDRRRLSITQVTDVDTFDENKIVLYTADNTLVVDGYDLHIQKLDVTDGALMIEGEIVGILYTDENGKRGSKGFFKKMLK